MRRKIVQKYEHRQLYYLAAQKYSRKHMHTKKEWKNRRTKANQGSSTNRFTRIHRGCSLTPADQEVRYPMTRYSTSRRVARWMDGCSTLRYGSELTETKDLGSLPLNNSLIRVMVAFLTFKDWNRCYLKAFVQRPSARRMFRMTQSERLFLDAWLLHFWQEQKASFSRLHRILFWLPNSSRR